MLGTIGHVTPHRHLSRPHGIRSGHQLLALNAPTMASIQPAMDSAQQATADALQGWIEANQDDASAFTAADYQQALRQLQGAVAAIHRTDPILTDALIAAIVAASMLAVAHMVSEVRRLSIANRTPVPEGDLRQMGADAIARQAREELEQRVRGLSGRYAAGIATDLRRPFAGGLVGQSTAADVLADLMRRAGVPDANAPTTPRGIAAAIARGLFDRYVKRALGIVSTEIVNAYAFAKDLAFGSLDQAVWLRRWDAVMDADTCEVCFDLDGEVRAFGEEFAPGIDRPTAHPWCRCHLIPWRSDWPINSKDWN